MQPPSEPHPVDSMKAAPLAGETPASEPQHLARAGAASRVATFTMLILALLLAVASAWIGARQAPHPDLWRPIANWDMTRWDWWAYPLERNAFKRVVVRGDLFAVHTLADGSQAWAVGSDGLILHTGDGGLNWEQLNPRPAVSAAPARAARGFDLLPSAHAQVAVPSKEEPRGRKNEPANLPSMQQRPPQQEPTQKAGSAEKTGNAVPVEKEPAYLPSVQQRPPQQEPTQNVGIPAQTGTAVGVEPVRPLDAVTETVIAPPKTAVPRGQPVLQRPKAVPFAPASPAPPPASAASAGIANTPVQFRRDPMSADLNAVTFVDSQRGWAAGEDGVVLATKDGGRSWSSQQTGMNRQIRAMTFLSDGLRGWVVGDGGTVMSTSDGGQSWSPRRAPFNYRLLDVSFAADGQRGWVVGGLGSVLATDDGGQTWREQKRGTQNELLGVHFMPDGRHGWVVGAAGEVRSTADGGQTWLVRPASTGALLTHVQFLPDGQRGWAVGADGTVLVSTNGGNTWLPQASGTKALLRAASFADDGLQGISVGHDGTLLSTRDGGINWVRQASGRKAFFTDIRLLEDGLQGVAVGGDGSLLATRDGGLTWRVQDSVATGMLYRLSLIADPTRAWAVGAGGTILAARDGGTSWAAQISKTEARLVGVHFLADGLHGWAVGAAGTVLTTGDGGQTWRPQISGTLQQLEGVAFTPDGQRGWAAGDGVLLATRDGGQTWNPQDSLSLGVFSNLALTPDGQRIWLLKTDNLRSVLAASRDGGQNWTEQTTGARPRLRNLNMLPDGLRGWAVGDEGQVIATRDGGASWTPRVSGTAARLNSVNFLSDGQRGWLVGEHAGVFGSKDAGETWTPLAEYRRHPPPWMFAALAVAAALLAFTIVFGSLRARVIDTGDSRAPQVLSALLTDRPLTNLNDDRLGHGPAVLALSDFMRNRDTDPHLTLAITAPWGMGKSSMMGMLRSELHKAGFRSAWFNAWHHQQEGRQLSALFNVIRQQAVPSFFVQPIGALRVRVRLLWARGWAYRLGIPLLALPLLALLWADLDRGRREGQLSLGELIGWNFAHHWLKEPRVAISSLSLVKLNPFAAPVPLVPRPATPVAVRNACENDSIAVRKPDAVLRNEVYCYLQRAVVLQADGEREACGVQQPLIPEESARPKHSLCIFETADQLFAIADKSIAWKWPATAKGGDPARYLLPSERSAIVAAAEVLKPPPMLPMVEHFIPLLALLGLLMTKGLSVYGLQLLSPLRSLLGANAGTAAAAEPAGTVERYRTEFRLLTEALDGRLVVFIDDLDRCDKDTVNSMLEMTNYLIDHGKCFIVIGAAMEHVKRCIEPKAQTLDKDDKEKFQTEYLRKIVHIELPVPVPTEGALDALLNGNAGKPVAGPEGLFQRLGRRSAALWTFVRPTVLVLAVLLFALLLAYAVQRSIRTPKEPPHVAAISMPPAAPAVAAIDTTLVPKTPASAASVSPRPSDRSASSPTGLVSGRTDWRTLGQGAAAAALLLLAALWLRSNASRLDRLKVALGGVIRTADSPQFMGALSLWKPAVRLYDPTPRGLKRFCNRARLFAIHERASHPAEDTQEVHVVALTAIHHVSPRLLDEIAAASREGGIEGLKTWIAKPADPATPEAALKHCLARHVSSWNFATPDTVARFSQLLGQISVR